MSGQAKYLNHFACPGVRFSRWYPFCDFFASHCVKKFLRNIFSEGGKDRSSPFPRAGELLWEKGQVLLSRTIEQALTVAFPNAQTHSAPLVVVALSLAGSFLSLLRWWLETDMPYSPEQMDQWFQDVALEGVRATIEGRPGE